MQRRRRINPTEDAQFYVGAGRDKVGLVIKFINALKGRGIFTSVPFEKGDFLLEYRGRLINKKECEEKLLDNPVLTVFMFEFHLNGKLWCVDGAKEDGSLGRLVNDNHIDPNAKMKYLTVQEKPHLCLFALRDISPGEEITYNYGDSDWPWRCKGLDEEVPQKGSEATYSSSLNEDIEVMLTESDQTLMADSMTNPVLGPLAMVEKGLDEEVPQKGSEATYSSSLNEDIEVMLTESDQTLMADSMTNPVLGPLAMVEKGLDEEVPQKGSEATYSSSLNEDIEVMLTESDQTLMADSMTNPVLGPLAMVEKGLDEEVPQKGSEATYSSSLNEDIEEEQFSGDELLSDQDSDPESEINQMSDEEYIPDSESDEDDGEDPDASLDFTPQSKVKPVMPDVGTSRTDTSVQDVPMVPSAAVASESGDSNPSEKKPEAEAERHKQEVTFQNTTIKNYCYVCGKPQSKISRHLKTHRTHAELVHMFSLPEKSNERKILLEQIRNKGNFKHNMVVLQAGGGPLKVKRQPKANIKAGKFIHCMYCKGMYIRKELWRHVRRCPCKPEDLVEEPGRTKVLGLAAAQGSAFCQQISSGVWKLLGVMKQDEVALIVRNDLSIIQFAQSLYNKHGQDPTKYDYIRQKLREVGRLLLCLRTEFSIHNMEEAVKPANFQRVVRAVKKVSGFDDEKHSFRTPSLALKLGHSLHKISDIIHCRALMAEDEDRIRSTDIFKKLYTSKWSELVSHGALNTLSDAKYNKPSTLPFTEDVQILHRYLDKSAEEAFCNLKEVATSQNYAQLAKVTLAQIIMFNRRRAGEVSKMRLKSFLERDNTKLHEDVAMGLSKTEQRLCNYFCRVEIMGKRGRKVAVLLTPSMVDALSLLANTRTESGVCATNVFLFARPKAMSHYRGQDCLRVHASQCGAKHPEHLRSTQLRKHVATLSQVLNLKNNELDQVADFLGHDIRVHRDFYRLPVPTTQLAKISKLLLSMEKGHLSGMQGKSLDEIEIEDEMVLSDAEANDSGSESDNSDTADMPSECVTSEPVETASGSTITEQLHDIGYIGKDSGKEHGSRRAKKKAWSKVEVAAVMRHFKDLIRKGKPASKNECSHCKQVEDPALTHRTVQNIRDFVRNRGIAAKRQAPKPTDNDQ
ncbi:Histone-lysine N-methyltransferase set-1 [Merluccius polli]|uniref:Histone-lysine N-methyltransferase set-1 n=1 Tax=Merluccius polli TaxID=89951 RepID=A0AA47N333_MERPO|nr:Histone-lysine N-methyltransferase set-1 [Merluccius polli]